MVSDLFDEQEARDPAEREAALMAALPSIIAAAKAPLSGLSPALCEVGRPRSSTVAALADCR